MVRPVNSIIINKCTLLLIFLYAGSGLISQEADLSRQVTIQFENITIEDAIGKISEASGLHFSYQSSIIDPEVKISLSFSSESISKVLEVFAEKSGLEYRFVRREVVLKKKRQSKGEEDKQRYVIRGFVHDKSDGESLIGATLMIEGTTIGVTSNAYGFYSFTLDEGEYTLVVSYIGFQPQEHELQLSQDISLDISLEKNASLLEEVTVSIDHNILTTENSRLSLVSIKPQNIARMPEFAGEVGLIRTLQTFPGITTHSDGSSFFFVRGGNKDQNLVLIDDAPVFNHSHLFGYYSVVNPEAARDIKVYKGDMPARFGDRLSSVVDIYTREGNLNRFEVGGNVSPYIFGLHAEGPVVKEKSSFFLAYRHSNLAWLYRRNLPDLDLYFFDLTAKLNLKMNNNNRLYFSIFHGKDYLRNTNNSQRGGIEWNNWASTLRWNHIYNDKLFSNLQFSGSLYNYYLDLGQVVWNSRIASANLKMDFAWYVSPGSTVRFGLGTSAFEFNPGNLTSDSLSVYFQQVPEMHSQKLFFFIDDEFELSEKLLLEAGLRLPLWFDKGPTTVYLFNNQYQPEDTLVVNSDSTYKSFVNLDPRIALKYRTGEHSFFKLGFSRSHQYLQMLSNSISPFSSFEVWIPSGPNIKPQSAEQLALGYSHFWTVSGLEFTSEVYYKWMHHQMDYEPHANLLLNPLLEGELRFGESRSYGFEAMLRRDKGRFSGWLSYTYSRALKKIEAVNDGKEFPAYYDRPHELSLFASLQVTERTAVSATWVYYTGSAITTPIGFYDYNGYAVPLYDKKNNDRLPDYHRLDLAFQLRLNKKEGNFSHSLSIGIYNFYNRKNPISVNFNKIETDGGKFVVPEDMFGYRPKLSTEKYVLAIMPSITYKLNL